MQSKKSMLLAVFLLVAALTSCGKADGPEGNEEGISTGQTPRLTEEEEAALQYLTRTEIEDSYDKAEYELYAPIGASRGEGYVAFSDHGLHYFATVIHNGSDNQLDGYFDISVQSDINFWESEDAGYWDIRSGEKVQRDNDRYQIASAMREDSFGVPCAVKKLYYMDVVKEGVGIALNLEVSEYGADEMTDVIIDELAKCYHIDLEELKLGDTWMVSDAKRAEQMQDKYEPLDEEEAEALEGYRYMGLAYITDTKWAQIRCPVMIPLGRSTYVRDTSARAHMHGVQMSGSVEILDGTDLLSVVETRVDRKSGSYERQDDYADVRTGSIQSVSGYDMARYAVITYEKKEYGAEDFESRVDVLCYFEVQEDYILEVAITLSFEEFDSLTGTLLKELEIAYGIDLSEYHDGEVAVSGAEELLTMAQLLENMDAVDTYQETISDTVLWFNATYAILTYSNGMDWRLPGGLARTNYNGSLVKSLLRQGWNVTDKESAMETLEWLEEEGHRKTYREYQEELEQLGMLDMDEDEFMVTLLSSMDEDLFRYMIVYSLYQAGLDEDAITAFDLCRANELCGYFYVCGYMTYEEAMDISLKNSLILQEKFSSWDELVYSYMLGYQFWKNDPVLTEDSPTLERYHYYGLLLEMEDGPYDLDWDMELRKEW